MAPLFSLWNKWIWNMYLKYQLRYHVFHSPHNPHSPFASIFFFRWNVLKVLIWSSYVWFPHTPSTFISLPCTNSPQRTYFFSSGVQNCADYHRCGLASTELVKFVESNLTESHDLYIQVLLGPQLCYGTMSNSSPISSLSSLITSIFIIPRF